MRKTHRLLVPYTIISHSVTNRKIEHLLTSAVVLLFIRTFSFNTKRMSLLHQSQH